jgi:hypothetical protein
MIADPRQKKRDERHPELQAAADVSFHASPCA